MVEVEITESAQHDIKNIIDYVFSDSVQNSEKLLQQIIEKIRSLKQFPEKGQIVKEIRDPQIRELNLHHLRIIYRCTDKVEILTVHHSARLLINNPSFKDLL